MKKISDKSADYTINSGRKNSIAIIMALFMIITIKPVSSFGQNNWDGDGVQGNFTWCENWYGNSCPTIWNSSTDLLFNLKNNSSQTSLYYNLAWKDIRSLIYQTTFPAGLNLDGNGNGLNFWHKVENLSSHNQVVNIPLSFKGSAAELNATNGNLTFQQPIYNDNNKVFNFYNNNNKSVILSSYIVGNSSVNLNLQSSSGYGIVQINSNMPNLSSTAFSGGININRGEVWFNQGSAINGGTIRVGNGDANICKLYINDADGGTTVTNAIAVPANSSNSYIGGLNTSGSNVFSGNFGLSATTTFENYGGGTLDLQGDISGSVGVNIGRISGTGSSVILYSTNAKTYTGSTNIYGNATLQLAVANALPATNNISVASGGLLKVSANQTIANLDLSGGGSLTVDNGVTLTITGAYSGGAGTVNNQGTIILASVSTTPQTKCIGDAFTPLSVNASGAGLTFQWYSNTSSNYLGGTSLESGNGAQTATYTPQSASAGSLYYYCVVSGSASAVSNISGLFTVTALPAAVTVNGAGTFCTTATITASNGNDGIIYFQGTTSGGTSTTNPTTSAVITTSGTYYFRARSAEGCWGVEGSAVVTINTPVTTSVAIVASANPVVSGTTVEFTATPVNGGTPSYAWYLDGDLQELFTTSTFSTNPIQGTQVYVIMTSSLPCTSPVQSNTITMTVTTAPANSTWDGSSGNDWHDATNWSLGVPGSTTDVIIPFTGITNFPTISSAAVCHNITLKSGASILGNNKLSVTGDVSVERLFTGNEWHLLSSPITNANTGMFTGKYLQYHNETNNKYYDILSADSVITVAKGYAIWGGSGFTSTFVGPLNDNNKSYPVKKAGLGWNLVGNPYPSYIDWNASGWTKTNILGTTYRHVSNNATTGWATYNGTTGTNGGTRYIAPCQGFFVEASANGTLGMSNAVRTHEKAPFYKSSEDVVPNLIRLEISGNGFKDDAVVYFTPTATTEFDGESDARKLFGDVAEAPQIYSFGPTPLAINTLRELASVPVGIHAGTNGTFTIAATEINDLSYVTLEDTKTGVFTELANKSYTFDFIAGENEQRFKLHFSSVGIDEKETTSANIYSYQQTVYVNLADNTQGDIYIYNLAGQLITAQESASGNVRIGLTSTGVYMVKVITEKETLTQKVVIR